MSKWMGLKLPSSPTRAALSSNSPKRERLEHRRKTSEETTPASRRSSQQPDAGSGANKGRQADECHETCTVDGHGSDPTSCDTDSVGADWEVLEKDPDVDRPLSPGVDFGGACFVDEDGHDGLEEHDTGNEADSKWLDAGDAHSFLVRGPTYLLDKAKRPAGEAMCRLLAFDCFSEGSAGTSRIDHIASRGRCRERVEALSRGSKAPFLFIMNIQVRGTPTISLVAYWAVDQMAFEDANHFLSRAESTNGTRNTTDLDGEEESVSQERRFAGIVASYANMPLSTFGGDESPMMDDVPPPKYSDERNQRFKLIPRIVGGPWMVRKAVGSTPVLLGTKIRHRYYRGERYIETDMDTGSSAAAASLCGRCRGLSRKIDVELGVVLQANSADELPEALLGAVRLNGFGVEDPTLQVKLMPSEA